MSYLVLTLFLKKYYMYLNFIFNLIFVCALTNAINLMLHFFPNYFTIQEIHTQRMIGKGKMLEGLYVLDTKNFSFAAHVNLVSIQTWHNRLGHLSFKCFDKLKEQLCCTNFKFSHSSPCYICPLAKQRRLPFVSHNNLSSSPIDLIYCDI